MMKHYFVATALCITPLLAQAQSLFAPKVPITITADDHMKWDAEKSQYTASGNVVIQQGKTKLTAGRASIAYGDNQSLESLKATGGVMLHSAQGDKFWGDTLDYTAGETTAQLCGNAKIQQRGNVFTGDCIKINTTTGTTQMVGSAKKRITAVLQPPKKQ